MVDWTFERFEGNSDGIVCDPLGLGVRRRGVSLKHCFVTKLFVPKKRSENKFIGRDDVVATGDLHLFRSVCTNKRRRNYLSVAFFRFSKRENGEFIAGIAVCTADGHLKIYFENVHKPSPNPPEYDKSVRR